MVVKKSEAPPGPTCHKCGQFLQFLYCDDDDATFAFNLFACKNCGAVLKREVWVNQGYDYWLMADGTITIIPSGIRLQPRENIPKFDPNLMS